MSRVSLKLLIPLTLVLLCAPLGPRGASAGKEDLDEDVSNVEEDHRSKRSDSILPKSNTTKNHSIDWDEVEANWRKVLSDKEVGEKWASMEKSMQNGVRSLLRTIFPQVVGMSSEAKVSGDCSAGILKWIISLRHLKGWALKMLDAIGKPPSGVLEGAITMFGNHRQCLNIRAPDEDDDFEDDEDGEPKVPKFKEFFRGQYCVLELKPWLPPKPLFYGISSKIESLKRPEGDDTVFAEISDFAVFINFVAIRLELCVPSICKREDIQRVANYLAKLLDFRARVTRCEIQQDSWPELSNSQVATLIIFVIVFFVIGAATAVTILLPLIGKRRQGQGSPVPSIIKSLSITNAMDELAGLSCYQKMPKIGALYGLRYFLMVWIISTHTITAVNYQFFREMQMVRWFALDRMMQLLTNSSLQYDSLIFLTAFCMAYYNNGIWSAMRNLIRKYFRIMPLMMVAIGILIMVPLISNGYIAGPTWGDFIVNKTKNCQENGWRNLFFIQNFYNPDNTCLNESWILCVEMQLALLFIPVMGMLSTPAKDAKKTERTEEKSYLFGWVVIGVLVFIGFLANVFEVYLNKLPPTWLHTLPDPEQRSYYFHVHLFRPWTHLSVYAIGVACGFVCRNRKKPASDSPYGSSVISVVGWTSSLAVMMALIFSFNDWIYGNLPEPMMSGLYDGFHRIMWALCHFWAVYAITISAADKQDSIVTSILGNKTFISFGRLTLGAIIFHPIVQMMFLSTQQTHLFSSIPLIVYVFMGNISFTYLLSLITAVTVEIPFSSIFCARDSTIDKQVDVLSYNKPRGPYTINGDMELSKSGKDRSKV